MLFLVFWGGFCKFFRYYNFWCNLHLEDPLTPWSSTLTPLPGCPDPRITMGIRVKRAIILTANSPCSSCPTQSRSSTKPGIPEQIVDNSIGDGNSNPWDLNTIKAKCSNAKLHHRGSTTTLCGHIHEPKVAASEGLFRSKIQMAELIFNSTFWTTTCFNLKWHTFN